MATIRERTKKVGDKSVPVFHVQVRRAGFPTRTASFPSISLARKWATTIEAEMIEGKHFRSVEARRRTVADAIDRYLREELPKKGDATPAARLKWWAERLGKLKLAEVGPALLVQCRGELERSAYTRAKPQLKHSIKHGEKAPEYPRSPGTVRHYLNALSRVFTVARKEWRWMSHNPFDGVSRPGAGRKSVRFLSEDERVRLLAETAKDPQLHTFVVLALATASRAGELGTHLYWRDVDLKDGRLFLRRTKNAQPRVVWVHGEALRLLKAHDLDRRSEDERVFVSETGKLYRHHKPFVAACEAANVKDFTFHGLRHSSATYLAREGATEQQLRAIGGWKSNVVSRYVHLAAEDAKAVVKKMNDKILGSGEQGE
jgi:integrase